MKKSELRQIIKEELKRVLKEGPAPAAVEKKMNAFARDVQKTTDFSDAWDDVSRSGVRYIAFEMEGMNKKAEGALKANVKKLASKYGFAYVPNYATAKKLGLGDAYADDAVTVYVGKD